MFHRIRTCLARTRVPLIRLSPARFLRPLASRPASESAPGVGARAPLSTAYPSQHPLRLTRTRPLIPDAGRRTRRTAMRLALDGIVVMAGVGQAYSVGTLVFRTTGAAT